MSLRNIGRLLAMVWETSPPLVIVTIGLRICRAVLPLAMLWVPKLILDAVVLRVTQRGGSTTRIWQLVALELGLAVLNDMLARANMLFESLLGDRFANRVSVRIIRHASTLDLTSFEDPVFYDSLERASNQSTGRLALMAQFLNIVQDIFSLVALSSGLIVFSPWLIVFLVCAVIPAFLGETRFSALAYSAVFRWTPHRRKLEYLRHLGASIESAKEVKIFGLGPYLADLYTQVSNDIYEDNKKVAVQRATIGAALSLISTGGYYCAYGLVLIRTLAGSISLGSFAFLTGAFSRSRTHIERIIFGINEASEQAIYLNDLFAFFQVQPSIRSLPNAVLTPRPISQGFEFRNVSFSYPGSNHLVLRNINFTLSPGEKLALIGENGAGKTTIVKLLLRLYDPTAGQILLDGVDLREYSVDALRQEIGVIFQDYLRYEMLVKENIGFGKIEEMADDEQ